MASIEVKGLSPNQNYKVSLFAVKTDPSGQITHSNYSSPLIITTSSTSASGNNLMAPNSGTDIQLIGGSIFAGDFPVNAGFIDVGGSQEIEATGVVLNSSGLAGFSAGVKEFWIEASTGKAYFAGTVTAGTVTIGSDINGTGKTGIYIDDKNYWYSDGSFSATSTDIAGAISNKDPLNPLTPPTQISNLSAVWQGSKLNISWDFDENLPANKFAKDIDITLTTGSSSKVVAVPATYNSYDLTLTQIQSLFNFKITSFSNISVVVVDRFGNKSSAVSIVPSSYQNTLPSPNITVTSVKNGYSVKFTPPSDPTYNLIAIEEIVSTASTAPATGYTQSYVGTLSPAADGTVTIVVLCADTSQRWVRATFQDQFGTYGPMSTAFSVTPTSPVAVNVVTPTEISAAPVASWSGDDINISYTLPSTNAGVRFLITLTAPDGSKGYFYLTPTGSNLNQTGTISKRDQYLQFGDYHSSFSGLFQSISATDVRASGISFNVAARVSSLASVVPVASIVGVVDGYTASFNFTQYPTAIAAEIYEKFTPWSVATLASDFPDFFTASYLSGGASGQSTLTVNNVLDNHQNVISPTLLDGYKISGTGIPNNTWITGVAGTGPFTLTLNNNLTSQASGQYLAESLRYRGDSPGNVFSDFYTQRYALVKYYDDYGNYSKPSVPVAVTPINPVTSLLTSALQIGSGGSIYVGASATSGARVLMGANSSLSGVFAFDPTNTNPTTSIIAGSGAGISSYTLKTTNARIADWVIQPAYIQNDLNLNTLGSGGQPNNYTGMSGSAANGYSFWAGSPSSGGSALANFSVTPLGAVTARKISIIGDGTSTELINAGGLFKVTNAGALEATSAKITGEITATTGNFTGNVKIGTSGSLYSGTINLSGNLTTAGYILNTSGLTFNNGTTNITTIDGSTGLFSTSSANIGGWNVNSTTINKTTGTGGNTKVISLDSASALIKVSSSTTGQPTYTAGMILPTSSTDVVFWAGPNGDASTSNAFHVKADGTLYASNAVIGSGSTIGSKSVSTLISDTEQAKTDASSAYSRATTAINTANAAYPAGSFNKSAILQAINASSNGSSLNGGVIEANTISATQIVSDYVYAGYINADKINAGTLTGRAITNGNYFSVDTSGNMTALSGQIGGFDFTNGDFNGRLSIGPRILFGNTIQIGWESGSYTTGTYSLIAGSDRGVAGQQFYVNTKTNVFRFAADSASRAYAAEIRNDVRARDFRYIRQTILDSSSRRFKENITYAPSSYYNRVLNVNPAFYTYKLDHPDVDETIRGTHGFGPIVEDLEDAGLGLFVQRNLNGEPTSLVNPQNMVFLLIPVVKDLKAKVESLENRIVELENK